MRKPLLLAIAGIWSLGMAASAPGQIANPVKFDEVTPYEVAKSPEFFAVADMNGDDVPDLVVSSPTSQKVSVLTGGAGGFTAVLSAGPFLASKLAKLEGLATGDLDGDGRPDVAVAESGTNQVIVLIGHDDGSLSNPVFVQTGRKPWGVAVGQFSDSSCNDMAVTNQTDNNVSMFFNRCNGNGRASFAPPISFPTSKKPGLLFNGDFNLDDNQDLLSINTGNAGANDATELLGVGLGNFQNHGNFVLGDGVQQVITADFNDDGIPDIASANGRITTRVFSRSFTVLLGDGNGFFSRSNNFPVDCTQLNPDPDVGRLCIPIGIAAGDYNLDGILDLAVAVAYVNKILIYAGNGDGSFDLIGEPIDIGGTPTFMAAADFDDDGRIDFVVATRFDTLSSDAIHLFLNNTDFPATPTPTRTPTGPIMPPLATATGSVRPPVTPSKQNGDLCGGEDECFSGFCEQGRCCNRACNGVTESCNQNPPGTCLPKVIPTRTPTTGGTGSTLIGRSSGCSTDDRGSSPWSPFAVVFVPAALWLGRRRNVSPARVPIRTRTR